MREQPTNPLWKIDDRHLSSSAPLYESGLIEVFASPVLVVEDDPVARRTLKRILVGEGHEVIAVGSCAEASSLSGSFSVAIFDIDLGDGCGVDLASELLEREVVRRAVFYTGCDQRSVVGRARQLAPVFRKGKLDALSGLLAKVNELAPR